MGKSRKLTLTNWTSANNALMQYFEGNKSNLAAHLSMSRTTISYFFNEKPIGENSFRKICLALRLNPKDASSTDLPITSHNGQPSSRIQFNEDLIEQVRESCRRKILQQHSRMRLLSGEEVGVDQLYVDVWLLKKPEHRHFNTPESLLSNFDIAEDRLALSKRIRRDPGFAIANRNTRLVILGKPGSGKTTFLKHLAVDWCKGKFQASSIAILVELRRIQDSQWDVWSAISQELGLNDWHEFSAAKNQLKILKNQNKTYLKDKKSAKHLDLKSKIKDLEDQLKIFPLHNFLAQGKLLILMDGFDELATNSLRFHIQEELLQVSQDYPGNRFIITCRTQVIDTIPTDFTPVEVADFRQEQVKQFVQNWFVANGQSEVEANKKWDIVQDAITDRPDLRELIKTPVLLSLVCLILQDQGEMPSNRGWLYSKGIKLLLSRWNDEKSISDWEIGTKAYRQLSLEDKEALLIEIAAQKFESPTNFVVFRQDDLVKQITKKLQLANTQQGVAVLKAIEAHHGLLIERADELWSFSHLTFQEHFTVQWLIQLMPRQLAKKIANRRWQNVVEQLVKSQQPADRLLRLIKQAVDQLIAQETSIQNLLELSLQKSEFLQTQYEIQVVRAISHTCDLTLLLALTLSFNFCQALSSSERILTYSHIFGLDINLDFEYARIINCCYELVDMFTADTLTIVKLDLECAIDFALYKILQNAFNLASILDERLAEHLRQLQGILPASSGAIESQSWWKINGSQWTQRLQNILLEYRGFGNSWQVPKEQRQQLQLYYQSNKFLIDLMNIQGAVSQDCRTEIMEGLLLPWQELQHRYPHIYGED